MIGLSVPILSVRPHIASKCFFSAIFGWLDLRFFFFLLSSSSNSSFSFFSAFEFLRIYKAKKLVGRRRGQQVCTLGPWGPNSSRGPPTPHPTQPIHPIQPTHPIHDNCACSCQRQRPLARQPQEDHFIACPSVGQCGGLPF
jgi:hypothetical protein